MQIETVSVIDRRVINHFWIFLEATVLQKSAAGRKRKTAPLAEYETCKRKKADDKKKAAKEAAGAPGSAEKGA